MGPARSRRAARAAGRREPDRARPAPRPTARSAGESAAGMTNGGTRPRGDAVAARELTRLHSRRLRACRSLGIPVPPEAHAGPPGTLLRRIALLDRRIEVALDLAGGRYFPPWDESDDATTADDDGTGEPFS